MQDQLHRAEARGAANHGWLQSHHSFSFASYYNPQRMGFGVLRVINDDIVAPSMGFPTHPHQNMEIISVPLEGALKHKDTMGNDFVIRKGEVQAMSAGTGIAHSEYNHSSAEDVNFLQIWVLPKANDIAPNYSQKEFSPEGRAGKFQLVVSPDGSENSVQINQDAFFSLVDLSSGNSLEYKKYREENGIYFFLLDGEIKINNSVLKTRDALATLRKEQITLQAIQDCGLLIMEIPMLEN
ncbi:MAG: pirin family protein [Spirochaetota bacterium]